MEYKLDWRILPYSFDNGLMLIVRVWKSALNFSLSYVYETKKTDLTNLSVLPHGIQAWINASRSHVEVFDVAKACPRRKADFGGSTAIKRSAEAKMISSQLTEATSSWEPF